MQTLKDEDIAAIFDAFQARHEPSAAARSLDKAFKERFRDQSLPDALNDSHELLIVAGDLDPSTERIVEYLASQYQVPINVAYFRSFMDADAEYLSRAWLLDPVQPEVGPKAPDTQWNGEFNVSFRENDHRSSANAMRFGYISAGIGVFHTNTLRSPGSRVPTAHHLHVFTVRSHTSHASEATNLAKRPVDTNGLSSYFFRYGNHVTRKTTVEGAIPRAARTNTTESANRGSFGQWLVAQQQYAV